MIEQIPVTDRDEWLARRALDLTASDIAAAAGLDRFKTPLQLYAEKTGMIMPAADNAMMRRGRWLESAVLEAIRDEHPEWDVVPVKRYYRDTELRLGATPDARAVTDEPGFTNIQCKVVSRPTYERDWSAGPPTGYVLQTLTEAMLMGADRSLLAALVIDTYSAELYLHPVPRHEAAEARVRAMAVEFWANIAAGRRPAADYARDAEVIEALHPVSVSEPVLDLSGDNMLPVLLSHYAVQKSAMALAKKALGEIEAEIKEKLGDAEVAELPGWRISWKSQHRKEHLVKASDYRVLRVRDLNESEEEKAA
jgi:predicted phage-related endonuclease